MGILTIFIETAQLSRTKLYSDVQNISSELNTCSHYVTISSLSSLDEFIQATDVGNRLMANFVINDTNKVILPNGGWINGIVWYQAAYGASNNCYGCAICKYQGTNPLYEIFITGTQASGFSATVYQITTTAV